MELTENIKRLLEVKRIANEMCMDQHFPVLSRYINERGYKSGIEIGVSYGSHSEYILKNCKTIRGLIGVDPYKFYLVWSGINNQQDSDDMCYIAQRDLSKYSFYSFYIGTSDDFFPIAPKVDFVFIDGDHSYEQVSKDIKNYSTLIKPGGILSGHDYDNLPGVKPAVDEFAKSVGKGVILEQGSVWVINY